MLFKDAVSAKEFMLQCRMSENMITNREDVFQKCGYVYSTTTFAWQVCRSVVSNAVYVQLKRKLKATVID